MTTSADKPDARAPKVPGRRRFLGAGTAAAPALLTLASQPALATGTTCFTPSRNLSKNTSVSQQDKFGTCSGTSVTTHKAAPAGSAVDATSFHPAFSGDAFYIKSGSTIRSCTMREVLNVSPSSGSAPSGWSWCDSAGNSRSSLPLPLSPSKSDSIKLAKHLIAAYLNCSAGQVPANVLTANGLDPSCSAIWTDFRTDGLYDVMAGVQWNASNIKDYLVNNAIAPA